MYFQCRTKCTSEQLKNSTVCPIIFQVPEFEWDNTYGDINVIIDKDNDILYFKIGQQIYDELLTESYYDLLYDQLYDHLLTESY